MIQKHAGDLTAAGVINTPSNWPFDIRRVPFYYGWVIWLVSTLGFLFSIPGQTMGMAVFTDHLIESLGLSRTQLSMAYLAGTVGSSLFLTRAGRWYDRFGGRFMVAIASLLLAIMLLFISAADVLATSLGGSAVVAFLLITCGYFGVRFFGQGVLTSCSRNVLLVWFVRRRGLVSSARGVFVSLGFSLAPPLLAWLIFGFGWREALWYLALACALFAVFAYMLLRNNPEDCGVSADGSPVSAATAASPSTVNHTLEEARHSPVFWIFSLSLAMHALFGTAVTFHVVSIFNEAGRTAQEAFAYFLPMAIISTSVNLLCGWLADTRPLKPFLIIMLSGFIAGSWGLLHLETNWGYWLLVAGFGGAGGLWSVLSNLAYIRNFGSLHLGAISGLSASVTVFGSAIGPALFSVGLDLSGNYQVPEMICLGGLVGLLVAAIAIPQREDNYVRKQSPNRAVDQ